MCGRRAVCLRPAGMGWRRFADQALSAPVRQALQSPEPAGLTHIELAETATDPANKERLFRHLQAEKKEGVVFKRLDAPYTPGRPNSGGNQLKHKFYATCSAVVCQDQRQAERRTAAAQWERLDSGGQRHHPGQLQGAGSGYGGRDAATCMPSGRAMPCISPCIWDRGRTSNSTNASSPSSNTRAPERRTCAD